MKKDLFTFLILIFLTLALFIWQDSVLVVFSKKIINDALSPFEKVFSGIGNFLNFWQEAILNIKSLKEENVFLINKNLGLESALFKVKELEEENNFLKLQLNLPKTRKIQVLGAEIISSDNQNNLRSFVINKGSKDGVRKDSVIISQGENLLGKVSEVSQNTAQVRTIFDSESRIAAETFNAIPGLIRGTGSDIVFDFVSKDKSISPGETVVSSGKDGVFPRGLLIGRIKTIKSNFNQVFQNANLENLIDFTAINRVFVILP